MSRNNGIATGTAPLPAKMDHRIASDKSKQLVISGVKHYRDKTL